MLSSELTDPKTLLRRDFSKVKPASDEVFRIYRNLYAYDRKPLNAKVESVEEDSRDWRKEKITFDAAYGTERMSAYLFLPKNVPPPYQAVMFFPSARVLDIPTSQTLGDLTFIDYVIKSGRVVVEHYLSVFARALGIEFEDRYKKYRLWQDPERVLADATPCQRANGVDPARAREFVTETFGRPAPPPDRASSPPS